jgi:precorrin-8X/cobalt-precorrin-8 methylmutase
MMFDTFAMVDWSAANVRARGSDSIWIAWRAPDGERLANPETRHEARLLLAGWLASARTNGERVLVGFDFPFGYPAGFAHTLGLSGPPWRAVWNELAGLIDDQEDNRNNRFKVALLLNERIASAGVRPPFWGCPVGFLGIPATRPVYGEELPERRLIDRRAYMPGAQPCWKLAYPGSVGSQSLTGLPVVRALRDDPRWRDAARVWPFETGLRPPATPAIVFAEVYPSLWRKEIAKSADQPKDKAQVRFVTRLFAERDRAGQLPELFFGDPRLRADERGVVETEEAWTLGVTAPRQQWPTVRS